MAAELDFAIEPMKFRRWFAALLLGSLALIWGGCYTALRLVHAAAEDALTQRVEADALVLEDQVSRTLDTVAARLKSVSAFADRSALRDGRASSVALERLIAEDRVVRSLSLVDSEGRVIASSSARNLGTVLPPGALHKPSLALAVGDIHFGQVVPYRDLADLAAAESPGNADMWLALLPVRIEGRTLSWVAVINVRLFQNLWARVVRDKAIRIGLYDFQGREIVASPLPLAADHRLGGEIATHAGQRERASFRAAADARFLVAYRSSGNHPVILAVIADRQGLDQQLVGDRQRFVIAALVATVLALGAIALLYRWYLRYEASATEAANQAKAIGAHLLVSESGRDGNIIRVNSAFLATTGYRRDEVIGRNHRMFSSGFHTREFYQALWETIRSGRIWKGTLRNRNKAGEHYWLSATIVPFVDAWGEVSRYVAFYSDITEAMSLSESYNTERRLREELAQINRTLLTDAHTDPLTGISNRRAFDDFGRQALAAARRERQALSLLLLDLDHFKAINDSYGHAVGDEVLKTMAGRWAAQLRASDMLARIGGEEFAVVLPHTPGAQALAVAEKIRQVAGATPVSVAGEHDGLRLDITVSVGLVSIDVVGDSEIRQLMLLADDALYEAKRRGRNQVVTREAGTGMPRLAGTELMADA